MKVNIKKVVEEKEDITAIEVIAHCRDCCIVQLMNGVGDIIHDHDGYVPDFLPGHHGDSLELTIDIETGQILNWPKITKSKLEEFINSEKD